jgi:hypothetical protein
MKISKRLAYEIKLRMGYWQSFNRLKNHVQVLSTAILNGNESGAMMVAIMTEGILEEIKEDHKMLHKN